MSDRELVEDSQGVPQHRGYNPPPLGYGLGFHPPQTDVKPRCWRCGGVFAWYLTRPWSVQCRKCRANNESPPDDRPLDPDDFKMPRLSPEQVEKLHAWMEDDEDAFRWLVRNAGDPSIRLRAAKYKLTIDQFLGLLYKQRCRCGVCRKPAWEVELHIDHNHETGQVRGLLCRKCNTGIGQLGDGSDDAINAARYLTNNNRRQPREH